MRPLLRLFFLLCVSQLLHATESGVALTIYNKDLATVRERRTMEFKSGVSQVEFAGVAARIDPTSVQFVADGVNLLEQNYDYALISNEALLQKFVDREIEVVATDGQVIRGTLLQPPASGDRYYDVSRQIILRLPDGRLRYFSGNHLAGVNYPNLPGGLLTKPTLRWKVRAGSGGSKPVEIAYLTRGIGWRADYALVVNDESDAARFEGLVTVDNRCGASFDNAKLKLLAGDIHRGEEVGKAVAYKMEVSGGSPGPEAPFEEKGFFEYHLYTLQEPTSILDRQTKQISLFVPAQTRARRIYLYDPHIRADRVGVVMEFENSEKHGLGMPLPAGIVRVFQKDSDGAREFLGDDRIKHTPRNEKVRIRTGDAFDIAVERKEKAKRGVGGGWSESDMEVRIRNHKTETVTVTVKDAFPLYWAVTQSSHVFRQPDSRSIEFDVLCEPEQEVLIAYTVSVHP